MNFRAKQMKVRRQAKEREESMKHYTENKEKIDSYREACAIIARLSRISHSANALTANDVLDKVKSRKELDFYYKWCIA